MKLWMLVAIVGIGFVIGGIWTRWLLEDRLLQTGGVLLTLSVILYFLEQGKWR